MIYKPANANFFENEIEIKENMTIFLLLIRQPWKIGASERKLSLNCHTICHLFSRCRRRHNPRVENASFIKCFYGIISLWRKAFGPHSVWTIVHLESDLSLRMWPSKLVYRHKVAWMVMFIPLNNWMLAFYFILLCRAGGVILSLFDELNMNSFDEICIACFLVPVRLW